MRRLNLAWEILEPQSLALVVAVHIDQVGGVDHHPQASLIFDHEGLAVVGAKLYRQGRGMHHHIAHASCCCNCLDSPHPVHAVTPASILSNHKDFDGSIFVCDVCLD